MAIPVQSFPILSFEQANPVLAGARYGAGTQQQLLQNQQLMTQLQYLSPMLAEQLKQAGYTTTKMGAEAQYAPQMELAKLLQTQEQVPYMRSEEAVRAAQIPYLGAETKAKLAEIPKIQMETMFDPYQKVGEYYSGLGKYSMAQYYNNPNTAFVRSLNTPAMAALGSSNPQMAKNIAEALSSITQRAATGTPAVQMPGSPLAGLLPQMNAPQLAQPQLNQPQLSMPGQGMPQQPGMLGQAINNAVGQGQPLPQPGTQEHQAISQQLTNQGEMSLPGSAQQMPLSQSGLTENDYKQLQQALGDSLLKKTTTAQIMNQRQYGGILDNLFDRGSEIMPSVVKYAGLLGGAKGKIDAVKSSLGETSADYANYLFFTRSLAPTISNEMRRVLGGQATDYEGKAMSNLSNPNYWDSNPQQALAQWNYMQSVYKKSVNPALAASPSEAEAKLRMSNSLPQIRQSIGIQMKTPDGRIWNVPADKVDAAKKRGATEVK